MKVTGICLGSLLILLTAFHFWFVNHAEEIIQDLVSSKSNGKLKLEVRKFKFNWFSKKMELEDAVFYTTDSINVNTTYRFGVKRIKLKVSAVMPMLFDKKILINDLDLKDPDILVTRIRVSKKDTLKETKDVSIPQEMGRIYNSIQDALQVLKVKKFEIENATVTLANKTRPDELPVTISRIDFHIDNLKVDTGKLTGREKIFFSDNIILKSRDQDILFPDKRHRISYRKFRINIEKKIVEFDSCTIAALKTDSSASDFSIFFDELVMTNIDFDTLYRSEVIKADSVYCVNPQFKLNVDLDKKTGPRKQPPRLDQIIRQLTGDLSVNFVIVNNAAFSINTLRNSNPSSFTSSKNNFEIQGLSIDNDAKRPLRVRKFAMAIRNYENFLRDSLYALQFDSVLINDDKIYLNNFSFEKRLNGRTVNRFKVPRFQLTGLSMDDLLFEQKLTAQQATLYNPTILYTENPKKKQGRRALFDALADVNDVLMLEDMNIINGNIDLRLNGGIEMQLKDATLAVESRSLLGSSQLSGIRRSVNHLDFSKGYFKINDLTVKFNDIFYTGADSKLIAGNATITNESKTIMADVHNVTMNQIFIDENSGDVSISGVKWEKADIHLSGFGAPKNRGGSFISLTDIDGNNTKLQSTWGGRNISADIGHIGAIAFLLKPGEKPIVAGLEIVSKDVEVSDSSSLTRVASLDFKDQLKAVLKDVSYKKRGKQDTADIRIPHLAFTPDVQAAISGQFNAGVMNITNPVVHLHLTRQQLPDPAKGLSLPNGNITKLMISQPEIHYSIETEKGISRLQWNGQQEKDNAVILSDVIIGDSAIDAKEISLSLNHFIFENAHGKKFDAGQGKLTARLTDFHFLKADNTEASWQATLALLDGRDFRIDSIGKRAGTLDIKTIQLKDFSLNSTSLIQMRKLLAANKKFRAEQITGGYTDSINTYNWYNAGYDKSNQQFFLDSFTYKPSIDINEFVKMRPYQADYIKVKTGAMQFGPFDIDRYLQDSVVSIGLMKISDVVFTDYRDNRLPFRHGIIKPLTVDRIKSIPFKLAVDTLLFDNANVTYSEVNAKTGKEGTVLFNRLTMRVFPMKNFDLRPTDSLRIHANGYLMDSIWVRLRLKESYMDTLSGFLLTVRMKPADMRVLNPVLGPLASANLRSGYMDSLSMRVAGNDYLAWGEMKLNYHDLKIEIWKKGMPGKAGFLSFLANTFIIKNKNTHRVGNVFFVRNRERSSLNYLIKMVMSGATSSVGAKSNKKLMRGYKKELEQRNLPPLDYD